MKRLLFFFTLVAIALTAYTQDGFWNGSTWVELQPVNKGNFLVHEGKLTNSSLNKPIIRRAYNAIKNGDSSLSYSACVRVTSNGDSIVVLPRIMSKLSDPDIAKQITATFANKLYLDTFTRTGVYKFNCIVNSDAEVLQLVDSIGKMFGVEWCEPNKIIPVKLHNPLYSQQYYLKNTGQNGGTPGIDINAEAAWQIVTGNPQITVAVIDSGVDSTHEDLAPNVLPGLTVGIPNSNGMPHMGDITFRDYHGTSCAGIIGAIDNNKGIRGVASGVKILPVNALNDFANEDSLAYAIIWASERADILSCSWGDWSCEVPTVASAINEATSFGRNGKGCIVVFSSGNNTVFNSIKYPARSPHVITVGAVRNNGIKWSYSCVGDSLDLVAPSGALSGNGDVVTTDISGVNGEENGDYIYSFGGTSAACAEVAGVAALMLSINPTLTQYRVREILRETASSATYWTAAYGYGRVNAGAAVNKAKTELPAFTTSKTYNGENEMTITVSAANNVFSYYFTTEWTVLAGNMTISTTGSNYCTLTKSTSGLPTGVVMMKVKFGDKVLYTTVVGLSVSDIAKYKQNTCTFYGVTHPEIPLTVINSGGQAHVHQGCRVYLYNDAFGLYQHYGNISHSGVTPDDWYVGNNNVQFSLPLGSGGIPFGVQVRDDSGTLKYQYIFFSYSGNGNSSLRINTISSSEYEISLCEDEDNQIVSQSNDDALSGYGNSEQTWRLEIYNTWDASKVYDQEIIGDKAILDTSGWRVGTYAIRAIRGDQVYTEKMLVK